MAKKKNYEYVLPEGFVLKGGENDYVIEKVLGKGGFGVTYKVKTRVQYKNIRIDAFFAVKEYFPDICSRQSDNATIKIPETKQKEIVDGKKDFINEGLKLQQVCKLNPNIVNVNEVFEANDTAYYVLEYLEGGDLRKLVQDNGTPLTEKQMLDVMLPVGYALQCLHDNRMLHLDVKPDNIVMRVDNSDNSMEPALIDFGIAIHFNNDGTPTSKTPSQGISPGYSPIEQYAQINSFDPRIDVYAYCATCYYLLTGKDPIVSMEMTPDFVRSGLPQGISSHVVDAIEHGMSMNKNIRTSTIEEVLRGLENLEAPELPEIPPKEEPEELPKAPEIETRKLGVLSERTPVVSDVPKPASKVKVDPNATKLAQSPHRVKLPDANKKDTPTSQKHNLEILLFSLVAVMITFGVGSLLCGNRIFCFPEGVILAFFAMLTICGFVGFILNVLSNSAEYKIFPYFRHLKYILLGVVIVTGVLFILGFIPLIGNVPFGLIGEERYFTFSDYDFYVIAFFAIVGTVGAVFLMTKKFSYNTDNNIKLLKVAVIIVFGVVVAIMAVSCVGVVLFEYSTYFLNALILSFFAMLTVCGFVRIIMNSISNSAEYIRKPHLGHLKNFIIGVVAVTCVLFFIGFIKYMDIQSNPLSVEEIHKSGFYVIAFFAIICTGGIVFLMIKKSGNDGNDNPDYYIRLLKITVIALGAISAICFLYWAYDYYFLRVQ